MDLEELEACVGATTFDGKNNILHFVNEKDGELGSVIGGSVFAFKMDVTTGKMEKLSEVSADGSRTSDVTFSGSEDYLLVTNYCGKGVRRNPRLLYFKGKPTDQS